MSLSKTYHLDCDRCSATYRGYTYGALGSRKKSRLETRRREAREAYNRSVGA